MEFLQEYNKLTGFTANGLNKEKAKGKVYSVVWRKLQKDWQDIYLLDRIRVCVLKKSDLKILP